MINIITLYWAQRDSNHRRRDQKLHALDHSGVLVLLILSTHLLPFPSPPSRVLWSHTTNFQHFIFAKFREAGTVFSYNNI